MDEMLLPILIALTIAAMCWAGLALAQQYWGSDKRKLKNRLSNSSQDEALAMNPSAAPVGVTRTVDMDRISALLVRWSAMQRLQRNLLLAFPERQLSHFLAAVVLSSVLLGCITLALSVSVLMGLAGAAVGAFLPFFILGARRAKRQKLMAHQLPEALDFLSRILRAGHSLSTGLQMMADELPQPMAGEFRRCYEQHSLGQSLEESLRDMVARVQSSDFAFFVTAVLIQRQTGGDLSEVLNNISGMIRQRIRLQDHVKAKTAEGRFTGYVLVAFPAVMFMILYFMSPDNARLLLHERSGQYMLAAAFGLQMLGLVAIRKITTVRV